MARAPFKQYRDLSPEDFSLHPIWVGAQSFDYDEDEEEDGPDEESFQPWMGSRPVGAEQMFLVSARVSFADGSEFGGFVMPVEALDGLESLGELQPQVFAPSGQRFGFWHGMFRDLESEQAFYVAFAKSPQEVFPVRFEALPGLTSDFASGEVPGFLSCPSDDGR